MEIATEKFILNTEQQYCFDAFESTFDNYLLTGKPGVGKSVLLRHMQTQGNKRYTFAAPTGLAALNINGRTLHSIFRLPTSEGIISPDYNHIPKDERVVNNIRYNIKTLVIDEVSMVRCDYFDYLDRMMKAIKGNNKPFGGVQVICVGDFFQLPPITSKWDVSALRDVGYSSPFIFSSFVFQNNFKTLWLNEVQRQKGDPAFMELLHSARTGSVYPKQLSQLNKKVGLPDDIRIKLTAINKEAESINLRELYKIDSPEVTFQAFKYGEWPAYPVEELLKLKVGAQVMVKMNGADRPPDHEGEWFTDLVNGTLAVVVEIHADNGEMEDIRNEWVTIEDRKGTHYKIYRKRWERKVKEQLDDNWREKVVASYEQMPLSLAWSISIHKSQGQSFDVVHIDASRVFAPGQLYVALSRCRSLDGISLEHPITTSMFRVNRDVIQFYDTLEN